MSETVGIDGKKNRIVKAAAAVASDEEGRTQTFFMFSPLEQNLIEIVGNFPERRRINEFVIWKFRLFCFSFCCSGGLEKSCVPTWCRMRVMGWTNSKEGTRNYHSSINQRMQRIKSNFMRSVCWSKERSAVGRMLNERNMHDHQANSTLLY